MPLSRISLKAGVFYEKEERTFATVQGKGSQRVVLAPEARDQHLVRHANSGPDPSPTRSETEPRASNLCFHQSSGRFRRTLESENY